MNKSFHILVLIFLLMSVRQMNAQKFTAALDKNIVGENERFTVEFTLSAKNINDAKDFKPPSFQGFRVLTGPNRQTNMQFINGVVSSSLTFSYMLTCSKVGDYQIGKASVVYEGKKYDSEPLSVKVIKGGSLSNSNKPAGGMSTEEIAKNVFIVGIVDKTSAYVGEQITLTYKFYTRLRIASPKIDKFPKYGGFWSVDLDMPNSLSFQNEMKNGQRFNVAVIKKVALFPTKTGRLEISPFSLDVPVLISKKRNTRDIFDRFFNDPFFNATETIDFTAKSNKIILNIKELPNNNVPPSFTGIVGDYSLNAVIDKKEVKQNEAVSLKINLEGKGNISLLSLPEPELPVGFEKYDPKISETVNKSNIVSGRKLFEYLIVPRIPGSKEIKPIQFSFFNPVRKRYITLRTPIFKIKVDEVEGSIVNNTSSYSKEDVRLLSQDIRYIKTSNYNLQLKSDLQIISSWFWYSLVLPAILLGLVIGIRKKQDELLSNQELFKFHNADKVARQRFKEAKKLLDKKDITNFYSALSQGLFGYLEDKLNISKSSFTIDIALENLHEHKVSKNVIEDLKNVSQQCEFVRFAPSSRTLKNASELYTKSIGIITNLEKQISSKKRK